MSLFSTEESTRLAKEIEAVELNTAGELVLATIPRADDYALFRSVAALLLTVTASFILHERWDALPSNWFLLGIVPVWLVLYWLLGHGGLLRNLVPKAQQHAATERKARELFITLGVTETRDRSGVLILLFETERSVQLLSDRGIHERVGTEVWNEHVKQLTAALGGGRAVNGASAILTSVGKLLAEHFPPRPDDVNELANEIRELD